MYCIQLHNTGGNFYILYLVYLHINNSNFTREILKYMYTVKIYHLKLLACKKKPIILVVFILYSVLDLQLLRALTEKFGSLVAVLLGSLVAVWVVVSSLLGA